MITVVVVAVFEEESNDLLVVLLEYSLIDLKDMVMN
jgi:hypothetical protein